MKKRKLLLGLMAMLLPLTTWAQNGDFEIEITNASDPANPSFIFDGGKDGSKPQIKVKAKNDGTGEIEELNEGSQYTVSYTFTSNDGTVIDKSVEKNEIRDAGTYTITVKGAGWLSIKEQSSTTFKITPKPLESVKFTAMTKMYGAEISDIQFDGAEIDGLVENNDAEIKNAIKCLKLSTVEGHVGTKVGEEIWAIVDGKTEAENTTSNYSYEAKGEEIIKVQIVPRTLTVSLARASRAYRGADAPTYTSGLKSVINLNAGEIKVLDGDEPTVILTEKNGQNKFVNVGTYTFDVELDKDNPVNKNYTLVNNTADFTISPAKMTIVRTDDEDLNITYGGSTVLSGFTLGFVEKESEEEKAKYEMRAYNVGNEGGVNGQYEARLYYNDKLTSEYETLNYDISDYTPVTVTMEAKTILTDWLDINQENLTYQGQLFDATDKLVVMDGDYKLVKGMDYEEVTTVPVAGSDRSGIDANTNFTVKINGIGNYGGTEVESKQFTIAKAKLTIEPKTEDETIKFSRTYDGTRKWDVTELFDIKGFVEPTEGEKESEKTIGLSLRLKWSEAKDAGENKSIYIYKGEEIQSLNKKDGEYKDVFTNYEVKYNAQTYTIEKADATFWVEGESKEYSAAVQQLAFDIKADNVVDGEETALFGEAIVAQKVAEGATAKTVKNVDNYPLEITNATAIKEAATNYNLVYAENSNKDFNIIPAKMTITVSDKSVQFVNFETELNDEALAELVTDPSFVDITPKANAFASDRRAVRNMITLKLGEGAQTGATGIYKAEDGDGLIAEIRTDLTEDQKNVLKNFGYGPESETFIIVNGTLTIDEVNAIVLNATNVDAVAEEGAEEVEVDESAWSVAKTIAKYNGAKVKKVTIKNLTNNLVGADNYQETDMKIKKGRWYSLVLPFDVTVAELSRKFGYAIVNVPDGDYDGTEKDIKGEPIVVKFRLEMGEIEANTLMLFKVAEDTDWGSVDMEEGVTFKEKTIVAPAENYAWPSDQAGHTFIGVYSKTTISAAEDYFYNSFRGYLTSSELVKNQVNDRGVDIYPLNGYFKFDNADAAHVRIFVQEADGTVTAISDATSNIDGENAEGWYTVGGVKLNAQPTQKGVYINNGQKVVIK